LPVTWYRNLSLGTSHGLMVALVSFASESSVDLAAGRSIAGTGGINDDGTVRSIGDLPAKARAARQIGADILLFPAVQRSELAGFESGAMQLVPVTTLEEAVAALAASSS
jgi:PDZ domain-containing protein